MVGTVRFVTICLLGSLLPLELIDGSEINHWQMACRREELAQTIHIYPGSERTDT